MVGGIPGEGGVSQGKGGYPRGRGGIAAEGGITGEGASQGKGGIAGEGEHRRGTSQGKHKKLKFSFLVFFPGFFKFHNIKG